MERHLWVLCATFALVLLYYYVTSLRRVSGKWGRLPPGPRPFPIIGNLLDLRGNFHHTLTRLARVYGPVMRLKLGLTTVVVFSSRDAAREAFTKHDRRLAARALPDSHHVLGFSDRSTIWLPSSDQQWKTIRGIAGTHLFSPRSLEAARGVRERKVLDLVSYVRGRAGQELEIGQAVYGGVLNLVSNTLFSADVVDIGAKSAHGLREALEEIIDLIDKPNVSDLIPFLAPLDLQGRRRWATRLYTKVFRILDDVIDLRLAEASSASKQDDFLDALLQLTSTGTIAREDARTIMYDMFAAGTDTTAITVEWTMAELLHNPGIMAKARAEIDGVLGSKETIEETDAADLPYLNAVIKEAMRLHPVAPILLPHKAAEDGIVVDGYTVPKGSTIIFNSWGIMRDPAVWERPDEFVPERWFSDGLAEIDFKGKHYQFVPFGSGRKICPGLPMAERTVPFLLASLLHGFHWKLPSGMCADQLDVTEKFSTANVMAVPLKAVPIVVA